MPNTTMKTQIQVRRDTTANWLANKDVVPAAGEPCFDLELGTLKIGDGVTTYENLKAISGASAAHYEGVKAEGESDNDVITRVLTAAGVTAEKDDIFVVKSLIADGKYSYTAYVYDGSVWAAMDGNYSAENVYFADDLTYTAAIGVLTVPSSGSGTDWYFEPKVVDNLVWLTKKLMAQYNIPADHVIRHYDVTGKLCPRPWCCADMNVYYKTSGDAQWEEFKKRISDGKEEDEDMTLDTFKELMKEYRAELQDNDCGTWSKEAREWAISNGLINGTGTEVNGEPNYAWADQLTREQAAALFYRFAKLMGKA